MTTWPFIAFLIVFAAAICAHFIFAYKSWWTSRGEQPSDIDPHYVRLEDYFSRSFRLKISEWLTLPVRLCMPDGTVLIKKGREEIRVSGTLTCSPQSTSDDILVVRGSFQCGKNCVFSREIYVYEDAAIGGDTEVQSIAVDGNLILAPHVRVARWADSLGDMEIGTGCYVGARATAGKILRLQNGAQVGSAFAETVCTSRKRAGTTPETAKMLIPEIELPPPAADANASRNLAKLGVDLRKLSMLSTDYSLYQGDLKPSVSIKIKTKLIVKGDCIIPPGSVIEGDLKAKGIIRVGGRSVCRGNVVADGEIWFGPSSRFYGIVHAGKSLRLSSGVRGGVDGMPVAAYGVDTVTVEDDVVVHGKLASGDRVNAVLGVGDSDVRKEADEALVAAYAAENGKAEHIKFN